MMGHISRIAIGLMLLPFFTQAKAHAHGVGNGGDHIRATFLSMGNAVMRFLDESDAGIHLKTQFQLDSVALASALDINSIEV